MLPSQLPDVPWVALDFETTDLHPDDGARVASAGIAWGDPDEGVPMGAAGFPFDQGVRDKLPTFQESLFAPEDPNLDRTEWDALLRWLSQREIVYHNAKFDLTIVQAGTREWEGLDLIEQFIWDTMVAARELEPTEDLNLDAVARRAGLTGKVGRDEMKAWLRRNKLPAGRLDLVPWDVCREYVIGDAVATRDVFLYQRFVLDNMEERDTAAKIDREHDLLRTLYAMERRGIGYNCEASLEAAEVLEAKADELRAKLPFDPDVKKSVAHWYVDVQGLEPDRRTEKKLDPQIDEEQLRKWKRHRDPEVRQVTADLDSYNRCKRAVSMWYRGYPEKIGADGRLRCDFKQLKVKSGRMSVHRVQLQAMPKKDKFTNDVFAGLPGPRTLMTAKPGHAIWQLDLSQAELRVASRYAGCRMMLQQLAEGQDIHSNTTMSTITLPDTGEFVTPDHPNWKEYRDIAKRLTFGGIFQIGAQKFQATLAKLADIHWPLQQCEAAIQNWRSMYPEFGRMYYRAMKLAERQGWVPLLKGTEYEVCSWFGPRDYPNSAWNRVVQGSLAEAFKLLLMGVERNWPGFLVLTVHDSVYLECPVDEGAEVAAEVAAWSAELMTNLFGIEMRMDIDEPKVPVA